MSPTDIANAAPANGARRDRITQPGDPAIAAYAIIAAVDAKAPPLRLVLGADSLTAVQAMPDQPGIPGQLLIPYTRDFFTISAH